MNKCIEEKINDTVFGENTPQNCDTFEAIREIILRVIFVGVL